MVSNGVKQIDRETPDNYYKKKKLWSEYLF